MKLVKLSALLTATVLALSACQIKKADGGISSGGGGTLPAKPIYIFQFYNVLMTSKAVLRMYINFQRLYPLEKPYRGTDKFFFGPRNLATVLEETDLEVLNDRACKDSGGNDVDASIFASKPNAICLSAFRIAPKLIEENAHKEINALILHELSHLLGATEKEARDLQQLMAFGIQNAPFTKLSTMHDIQLDAEALSAKAHALIDDSEKSDAQKLYDDLRALEKAMQDFSSLDRFGYMVMLSLFDGESRDWYEVQSLKIRLAGLYVGSTIPGQDHDMDRYFYQKSFQGADELTFEQIESNAYGVGTKNIFKDEKIKHVTNRSELKALLESMKTFYSELTMTMMGIAIDYPLPELTTPLNPEEPSPFLKFVGRYEVTAENCTHDFPKDPKWMNGLTSLEIVMNPKNPNHVDVTSSFANSRGTDTYARNYYGVNRITGDHLSATRVKEEGFRWYNNNPHGYHKSTNRIALGDHEVFYTIRHDYSKMTSDGTDVNFYQCVYTLKKVN